jgi:hypothetical protein
MSTKGNTYTDQVDAITSSTDTTEYKLHWLVALRDAASANVDDTQRAVDMLRAHLNALSDGLSDNDYNGYAVLEESGMGALLNRREQAMRDKRTASVAIAKTLPYDENGVLAGMAEYASESALLDEMKRI